MRYTGSPLGEEGKSLIVAIMMASTVGTVFSEQSVKKLADLKEKRHIQIYISPT
jgi:thioredoxin reductase (NADPH)